MKTIKTILLLSVSAIFLVSCSSSLQQRQVADDLYYSPDKNQNREIIEEFEKDYNKAIAENEKKEKQEATQNDTVMDFKKSTNPYEAVLADNMEEAYKRRENARRDLSYGMSDYYSVINSDDYWYASTYDPAFYNMIIAGNSVWVEPKWISTGYGYGYNYGNFYNRPMTSWGYGFSHYPFSMNSFYPYRYSYGYNYGYYGYGYNSGWYSPYMSNFFNSNFIGYKSVNRKFPRSKINNNTDAQNNPAITRHYSGDNDTKATINTKGRGDKIRTINRDDKRTRTYIRKSERNNSRENISARRYEGNYDRISDHRSENTAENYIGDRKNRRSSSNRYYKRPQSESNYNELRDRRTRSYNNNSNNNKSRRYYNRNNSSNNNSSSSITRSSSSSSNSGSSNNTSSSSSSSSGRKKR